MWRMVLCRRRSDKAGSTSGEVKAMHEETIEIEGMSCSHCIQAVETALRSLAGVEVRRVEIGRAAVAYDPATVNRAQIVAAVEDAGFQVV
ncbi:heavy-metal-associated domain-containing protein [Chloracidobacterium sp. D]|nr:heavy-metal-associated domain-containing protein [Chloracidobacterium sp. D]